MHIIDNRFLSMFDNSQIFGNYLIVSWNDNGFKFNAGKGEVIL